MSRIKHFVILILLSVMAFQTQTAAAQTQWGGAGGRLLLTTGCPAGGDCRYVGTHTVARVDRFSINSNVPDGTYGFGVGHITTGNAKNWATYENEGKTYDLGGRFKNMQKLRASCSIDGHLKVGNGPFQPRTRHTSYAPSSKIVFGNGESGNRNYVGVGLAMRVQAACIAERFGLPVSGCQPEHLQWECIYDPTVAGFGDMDPDTSLPPSSPGPIYMPSSEDVYSADHGSFVRPSSESPTGDAFEVTFFNNHSYFFGGGNPVAACEPTTVCNQSLGAADWITHTDNHEDWNSVGFYSSPDIDLRVYDATDSMWSVCFQEGGEACGGGSGCGRRFLTVKHPTCQQQDQWCWATAIQNIVFYERGQLQDQCDIVKIGKGSSSCPNNAGSPSEIITALDHYGVDVGSSFQNHPGGIGAPSFEALRNAIDRGNPTYASLQWNSSDARHAVVIVGYECDGAGLEKVYYLYIRNCVGGNPNSSSSSLEYRNYSDFKNNSSFSWRRTLWISP